ncbi:hypothetical protein FSP39_006559 [Pinctada imbricata]|uniref:Elongation of very long chain fatty acids protein n=1 Tax=Pinctada imbricata TaxID=66713 RepID=A0AA88XWP5_PINIB|nr:hypothetical protein FSP39_006559 [Pinctada imbricata]
MESPVPIVTIFILYLVMVKQGPKMMEQQKPMQLSSGLVIYNLALVCLSAYMFEEFLVTAILSGYSLRCQPVDYSNDPLAIRMASVCWWYFFSKVIELADTSQFFLVILHTGYNLTQNCDFPAGFNYAVFIYAITLIILFSNFYSKAYNEKKMKQR